VSAREVELKAVVGDPAALEARLDARGAVRGFRGRMSDRRYDVPSRALEAEDRVLRVRAFGPAPGSPGRQAELAWKGPTRREDGYKVREELQVVVDDASSAATILARLGFCVTDAIDRCVEFFSLEGAALRLEWYPRMDVLLEVEGEPPAIEAAVTASGVPRADFLPDRLLDFAARYRQRTGRVPALNLASLGGEAPAWPAWGAGAEGQRLAPTGGRTEP